LIIRLLALFPEHLNLNGDLANLRVLQQRLAWRGVTASISSVNKGDSLSADADFILLGHGSEAAWLDLANDLERLKPELLEAFESGVSGLAVGSGYERLFNLQGPPSLGLIPGSVLRTERVSKFVVAPLDGQDALGYLNSDALLEPMIRVQNLVGTLLHGPILAKNPILAESIIESMFKKRGVSLPPIQAKEKADQVADLISKIWQLEEPLARE
jgi:CobQ-like glutamine amidotransferase family enzyme